MPTRPDTLDAVIVNTAGGMTGGDRFGIDVTVGAGARLTVTTAAAEKIYRSLGPETEIAVKLDVGRNAETGLAAAGDDPVRSGASAAPDRCRSRHRMHRLLLAEAIVFGRSAMGETVQSGTLSDRWRVRRGGALVFAETLRLDGAIAATLARRAVAAGGVAIATVLKSPGQMTTMLPRSARSPKHFAARSACPPGTDWPSCG